MQCIIPSVLEVVITHPLDVIKTRLQTQRPFQVSLRELSRGFMYRAAGFVPARSAFWWAQHNHPFDDLHIIPKALYVAGVQSLIDIPVDYMKIRSMNSIITPHSLSNIGSISGLHYLRNSIFCSTLLSVQLIQWYPQNPYIQTMGGTLVGSIIGSILSQPFDGMKSRITCGMTPGGLSWVGVIPRMCITSSGLTIGALSFIALDQMYTK